MKCCAPSAQRLLIIEPRPVDQLTRALEPNGVDYAFDAIGGANIGPCIGALRRGGTLVAFGFMAAVTPISQLAMFANIFLGAPLRGRKGKFYGITMLYRKDPQQLREDLPKIFSLLGQKKIDPLVNYTFPLLDAAKALEFLAAGSVEGKIVLVND